jgi:UDP-3-O-[3-hydroxymyristoyl] glucosamine N-acyltransferase
VRQDVPLENGRAAIRAINPRTAAAKAIALLHPPEKAEPGVHPAASVDATSELGEGVSVGPRAVIGGGVRVGAGTRVGPGCVLGKGVSLGENCLLYPNVTIYAGVTIGDRAIIHSGAVIGADGFGFVFDEDHYEKFPQIGSVRIGDDVEVGANTCIDRAALGLTEIGDGTKLDNMVHVGHNCRIGRHVVVAAQTGFSGGVVVEDLAVIGGQVGIGDKARIESKAVLGSGCGILTSKIVHAGQVMWGTPARPLREHLEQLANLSRLPDLRRQVAELRDEMERLKQAVKPED